MARWYKCDLQMASPRGGFRLPNADLASADGRRAAARDYVGLVRAAGLDVFAITDHNDTQMLEEMRYAARESGITMFPGMELSTGSGSDGVHLLLLGDPNADIAELSNSWRHAAGFTVDHPPFYQGRHVPSPRSFIEILDNLPEDTLAIAPHVLNENGIASRQSIQEQSLRWRCLHHDRLEAIEVGSPTGSAGWNDQFRQRELEDFPLLQRIAFVSTSDAYLPGDIGAYTWIRMREPSLDGLRQAFLDHEARVICDWSPRGSTDPNEVSHGFIDSLSLQGLATSAEALSVNFDPRVNVIIGSRGSGKSTIVEGLRALYGRDAQLPDAIATESDRYQASVFGDATLMSGYSEAISGSSDVATWTRDGETTTKDGQSLLAVRVVTQKELFERTSGSALRRQSPSSNMLALVDEALDDAEVAAELLGNGYDVSTARAQIAEADLSEKQTDYVQTVMRRLELERRSAERPALMTRIGELKRKISALEDEGEREQLADANAVLAVAATITRYDAAVGAWIENLRSQQMPPRPVDTEEFAKELTELADVATTLKESIETAIAAAENARAGQATSRGNPGGPYAVALEQARQVQDAYRKKLVDLGVEVGQYDSLKVELETSRAQVLAIDEAVTRLPTVLQQERRAWEALDKVRLHQTEARRKFLELVSARVPTLRFLVLRGGDPTAWKTAVHQDLGLRQNDHQDSLDALARWLWVAGDEKARAANFASWQSALLGNDYSQLCGGLSASFLGRLQRASESVRVNLASRSADDALETSFLKEGADPSEPASWQRVTDGSPGQRSAAMLAFILSYGDQPLVLDQPEDDLDSKLVSDLVVSNFRTARWHRQLIVVTRDANVPVNVDAEQVIVLESIAGCLRVKTDVDGPHVGPIDAPYVRQDIQNLLEGGVRAFINRERRYDNELSRYRQDLHSTSSRARLADEPMDQAEPDT
jgi:energy-coupling factor transporter ATP-binding protein EcfA2